jgi:CHAD domain-containing protein
VSPDGDIEELHKLRVAIRTVRALLRAARPLIDDTRTESLRAELGELGRSLGTARDLDVFTVYLRKQEVALDGDANALVRLLAGVEAERRTAYAAARESLDSADCGRLVDDLDAFAGSVTIREVSKRELVDGEFRRLRKAMRDVESDEAVHRARICAKRVRYAAEATKDGKLADRAKRLQDVLGEHQDAVVAEERLRSLADPQTALVIGRLIERQAARRARARAELPNVWRKLEQTR